MRIDEVRLGTSLRLAMRDKTPPTRDSPTMFAGPGRLVDSAQWRAAQESGLPPVLEMMLRRISLLANWSGHVDFAQSLAAAAHSV